MYYILYRLDNLKVVHKDTKPLKPQLDIYGIAEYNGEIPKNDWLTVDNIREEIETWTEKELNEQGQEVEYSKTHIVCDLVAHFYPKREWTEEQKAKQKQAKYENLCQKYIREQYSATDENKVVREYLADMYNFDKKSQFDEYNAYVESCKARAKGDIWKI